MVSVVVPFHEVAVRLPQCLDSLAAQTYPNVEVVLVDDGASQVSVDVAQAFVRRHANARLVRQRRAGVGAARNAGVAAARGAYLAFCDSDDTVLSDTYARLVGALEASGSDIAIGSVTMQTQGRHVSPPWARRSNPNRLLGTTLVKSPYVMANTFIGARAFRRTFWDRAGLRFDTAGDHSDIVTVVRSLVEADRIDVLPAVVYRWWWREDGLSLWQQGLLDGDRAADRIRRIREAAELLSTSALSEVRREFVTDVLQITVPGLVRAAVVRTDGYWESLRAALSRLLEPLTDEDLLEVPFEDRMTVWLCAHDHRTAAEDFLEYAFDNQNGYPYRWVDGHPEVTLDILDRLPEIPEGITRVADVELHVRSRLTGLRWLSPTVLEVRGAVFVEYLDDRQGQAEITLVLRNRRTGLEQRLATQPAPDVDVNQWSQRAQEDHTSAGFRAEVDITHLAEGVLSREVLEVQVELVQAGGRWRSGFLIRQAGGSAGLLEPSGAGGLRVKPVWRSFEGLKLHVRRGLATPFVAPGPEHEPRVESVTLRGETLVLSGQLEVGSEVRLRGPRGRSDWVAVEPRGDRAEAVLDLGRDEWGAGRTPLPMDRYALEVRDPASGEVGPVRPARDLWRSLPRPQTDGPLQVSPSVTEHGRLDMALAPQEWRSSRPPYMRRRLRDEAYPAAREKPLLDVALFETFAGKAGGDNPGALCKEMVRRGLETDLVYSVLDRSVEVPAGVRSVVRFSSEYFELLGRARYLIVNASLPYFFRKRPGQLYFQTWHGSPLKRIAHDRPHLDFFNWHHRRQLLIARDGWDYLLSQSDFCTGALRSAFRYDGEVLELGYPRNDVMSSPEAPEVRARVRKALGLADDAHVILYAPTWRDNQRQGRVFNKVLYLEPETIIERLDNAVVLVRGHYNSVRAAEGNDPEGRVIDVTRYPDIADLYLAADALVTDYSSVFFDFVLTDKPMVFLAPDLTEYRDNNRGFYLDYHSTVPGPVCETTAEVVACLAGEDRHREARAAFRQRFASHDDGAASERVVDAILEWGLSSGA